MAIEIHFLCPALKATSELVAGKKVPLTSLLKGFMSFCTFVVAADSADSLWLCQVHECSIDLTLLPSLGTVTGFRSPSVGLISAKMKAIRRA